MTQHAPDIIKNKNDRLYIGCGVLIPPFAVVYLPFEQTSQLPQAMLTDDHKRDSENVLKGSLSLLVNLICFINSRTNYFQPNSKSGRAIFAFKEKEGPAR